MKEDNLFCFVFAIMRSTELGCFRSCSWCLWWGGVHGLGSVMFGLVVQKFLNIEWFLYWKFNRSWKFQRNWNMPLVLFKRSWWIGFNGIDLVRFGFRKWEILIFTWFMPLKIQINPQKENISWGCGNTWANGIGHTSEQLN
jgi:hypothetical protein